MSSGARLRLRLRSCSTTRFQLLLESTPADTHPAFGSKLTTLSTLGLINRANHPISGGIKRIVFKIVRDGESADFDCVRVTLLAGDFGACGWYLCPTIPGKSADGYLPKSANMIASLAISRATIAAERLGSNLCIIDPDNL